jgi:hypothetical protein
VPSHGTAGRSRTLSFIEQVHGTKERCWWQRHKYSTTAAASVFGRRASWVSHGVEGSAARERGKGPAAAVAASEGSARCLRGTRKEKVRVRATQSATTAPDYLFLLSPLSLVSKCADVQLYIVLVCVLHRWTVMGKSIAARAKISDVCVVCQEWYGQLPSTPRCICEFYCQLVSSRSAQF